MLDVSICDKYPIEFKTHYRFQPLEKQITYAIEIYMFVSNSLDVDSNTYPKYQFYRDLQTYPRFETPASYDILIQETVVRLKVLIQAFVRWSKILNRKIPGVIKTSSRCFVVFLERP